MRYFAKHFLFSIKVLFIGSILALSSNLAFAGCTPSLDTIMIDIELNLNPNPDKTTTRTVTCKPDINPDGTYTPYGYLFLFSLGNGQDNITSKLQEAQGYWKQGYLLTQSQNNTGKYSIKAIFSNGQDSIEAQKTKLFLLPDNNQVTYSGTKWNFKGPNDAIMITFHIMLNNIKISTDHSAPLPVQNLFNTELAKIKLENNDESLSTIGHKPSYSYLLNLQINSLGDARYMKCYGSTVSVNVNPDPIDFGDVKQSQLKSGGVKKPFTITVTKNDTENSCTESFYPRIAFIAPNNRLTNSSTYDMENGTFLRIRDSSGQAIIFTKPGNITTGHFYFNQNAQFIPSVQSSTSVTQFTAELKENTTRQLNPGPFEATIPLLIQYY